MYKPIDKLQHSFLDFNQPLGLHMNPDNAGSNWLTVSHGIRLKPNTLNFSQVIPVM